MPHRLAKILEGESLLNDASALLIYRVAIIPVRAAASRSARSSARSHAVAGSLVAGYWLGRIQVRVLDASRGADGDHSQFCPTFGVWISAEAIGLSAILTLVAYAMTVARTARARTRRAIAGARVRGVGDRRVRAEVLAFVMIGMQVAADLDRRDPGKSCITVLGARHARTASSAASSGC